MRAGEGRRGRVPSGSEAGGQARQDEAGGQRQTLTHTQTTGQMDGGARKARGAKTSTRRQTSRRLSACECIRAGQGRRAEGAKGITDALEWRAPHEMQARDHRKQRKHPQAPTAKRARWLRLATKEQFWREQKWSDGCTTRHTGVSQGPRRPTEPARETAQSSLLTRGLLSHAPNAKQCMRPQRRTKGPASVSLSIALLTPRLSLSAGDRQGESPSVRPLAHWIRAAGPAVAPLASIA